MKSKWIIWTYVPYFAWAGWIHAGIRAQHTKYFFYAALYGVPFMLAMAFSENQRLPNGEYSRTHNVIMSLNVLAWIGGIIHANAVKKEVDLRIKYANQATNANTSSINQALERDRDLERRIATEYGTMPPLAGAVRSSPRTRQATASEIASIDVNIAGEPEIAALPGIGPILAKKAVKARDSLGGFESLEQFSQALDLKPHIVEQIRPRVLFRPKSTKLHQSAMKTSGRVVDF